MTDIGRAYVQSKPTVVIGKTYADGLKDAIVWLTMNCKEWKPEALAGELASDFAEHVAPERVQNVSVDSGISFSPVIAGVRDD